MNNVSQLFETFEKLSAEKFSGEVEITSSQGHATILIKDGRFVWAHRSIDRAIERYKKMDWLKMPNDETLSEVTTWRSFIGLLLSFNAEQYGKVVALLKIDRLEVFFRIFFWSNLETTPRPFDVGSMNPEDLGFYSLRQFDRLLQEAKRRLAEWPQMKIQIGSSKRIFTSQVDAAALSAENDLIDEGFDRMGDDTSLPPANALPSLPFSVEEIELLRRCDGRNTIQDIVRLSYEGEFLTVQRLLNLWRKGAIRSKDDGESESLVRIQPDAPAFKDIFASLGVGVFVCLIFIGLKLLSPKLTAEKTEVPLEMAQSLEIYRKIEGRYPVTLNELPAQYLPTKHSTDNLIYSLSDPLRYELRLKP